jgi:hypothetical protein
MQLRKKLPKHVQNRILLELENELLHKRVENLGAFIQGDNDSKSNIYKQDSDRIQ